MILKSTIFSTNCLLRPSKRGRGGPKKRENHLINWLKLLLTRVKIIASMRIGSDQFVATICSNNPYKNCTVKYDILISSWTFYCSERTGGRGRTTFPCPCGSHTVCLVNPVAELIPKPALFHVLGPYQKLVGS